MRTELLTLVVITLIIVAVLTAITYLTSMPCHDVNLCN